VKAKAVWVAHRSRVSQVLMGKLTVELMNNGMFYMVSADVSIDGVSYSANRNTNSFAAVPH